MKTHVALEIVGTPEQIATTQKLLTTQLVIKMLPSPPFWCNAARNVRRP
jgi:hypothetical protein